jgi:threonine aldolase
MSTPEKLDFRSDTVTQPSPEMREAMISSKVGDDVFGEDPTINILEEKVASLFGMESALFVPSGTMSNQIAIKAHTQPGNDIICDYFSHIYQYEGGGIGMNSGCSASLIHSPFGQFSAVDVESHIYSDDIHKPISRLVSVENTCNKGGGTTWKLSDLREIRKVCNTHDLGFHMDGARLFNAMVANSENPKHYGELFDTISICFSKGLGAPVGSVLVGKKELIHKSKRFRKAFGGGMRQAGFLAAAAIYALDHNVDRLAIDHKNAKRIEACLTNEKWVKSIIPVETNIVIFEPNGVSDKEVISKLASKNILASGMGNNKVRFVTHLDITESKMNQLLTTLSGLF